MSDESKIIANERKALMNLMDEGSYYIPKRQVDENILIATWNIAQFSESKTDRAIQYIADICERFDIIAIQEVKSDLHGLSRLQKMLPGNYKIIVSDITGNSERMAFLYDKRTVINTGLVCEIAFNGTIKKPNSFMFNRTPYCASFRAGRFDFTIVSVHIVDGSGKSKEGLELREKEIDILVKYLKKSSSAKAGKVFDSDFFVVGDFNIQKFGDKFFNALVQGPEPKFLMPPEMNELNTNFLQTKPYDKIAWLPRPSFIFSGKFGVVPFGNVLYKESGQPKNAAKSAISDHLPLWAEFKINELTQNLDQIINR